MARLIRVIQSLPTDRMNALGHSLGVAETGNTAGELARKIYHVLSDKAGIERALTHMAAKDRLVLMMIATSPNGRSTMSRLRAEAPFSTDDLSEIVARLSNSALLQVSSPAEQSVLEMETPAEIRSLLRTGESRPQGRVAERPKRRPVSRTSKPLTGYRDRGFESPKTLERAKISGDPVSEMTDWANQNRPYQTSDGTKKRRPTHVKLAEVLGLCAVGGPFGRLIAQWLTLSDDDRRMITLRAWLHDNGLAFAGGSSEEIPARRLVRMASVAMLSQGIRLSASGRPQQIEEGLKLMGLDRIGPIPRYRWRVMVQSVLADLEVLGIVKPDDGGFYVAKSASMQRICANALEIRPGD